MTRRELKSVTLESDTLQRITETVGEDAALRLAMEYGGLQLYVPLHPPADSPLIQLIGEPAARALAKRWGGCMLIMPLNAGRRARIIELRRAGTAVHAIASQLGCTERHVYAVIAAYKQTGGVLPPSRKRKKKKGRRGRKRKSRVSPKPPRPILAVQRSLFDEEEP